MPAAACAPTEGTPAEGALAAALALLDARPVASADALLALAGESHPLYRGRGAAEAERLRAYLVTRIAAAGLAEPLLPYALEELETGRSAAALAAAALVLRHAAVVPDRAVGLLAEAVLRLWPQDEPVDFAQYPPGAGCGHSAVAALLGTLGALGPTGASALDALRRQLADSPLSAEVRAALSAPEAATCCRVAGTALRDPAPLAASLAPVAATELENQDGVRHSLGHLLAGRTSLVAFFYTRCMNPLKCSRTVSLLGDLGRRLAGRPAADRILVAGITYDPAFDGAERLLAYGRDRSLPFGETCQLLRTTGPFSPLAEALNLGVGFGQTSVNAHRIEWLLVRPDLQVSQTGTRSHWDPDEMATVLGATQAGSGVAPAGSGLES